MSALDKLSKEIRESWQEFNQLIARYSPQLLKDIYKNKPLFYTLIVIVVSIELIVALFVYFKFIALAE